VIGVEGVELRVEGLVSRVQGVVFGGCGLGSEVRVYGFWVEG